MAKIDILVPCYQYGHFLRECVNSILDQDLRDQRVLIIDNASTDNSAEVAQSLAKKDSRVEVVIHKTNSGYHASYNEGIDWASSEYFLILDADDMLAPGALTRAISFLDQNPNVSFIHGAEPLLHVDGSIEYREPRTKSADWQVLQGTAFILRFCREGRHSVAEPTVIRRTQYQKEAGYFRKELPFHPDIDMWLRLALLGDVGRTQHVQAIRRAHGNHYGAEYQSRRIHEFLEREKAFMSFLAHEGRGLENADELKKLATRGIAQHAYWSAVSHALRRQPGAWDLFQFACTRHPRCGVVPPVGWLTNSSSMILRARTVVADALGVGRTRA